MNDGLEPGEIAWVVSWMATKNPQRVSSRAYKDEDEARRCAARLASTDRTIRVAREPDLTADQVYPLFVAGLGSETSPGVIFATGLDGRGVKLLVDRDTVIRDAYMENDIADDRDVDVIPKALHPRRLGLMWLIGAVEDEIYELDPTESRLDLRHDVEPHP